MKCIILCAGYGTRLYPLTKNKAKPLLSIGDKLIIDHIIGEICKINSIDEIIITTNKRFAPDFEKWKKNLFLEKKVNLFVNHSEGVHQEVSPLHDLSDLLESRKIKDDFLVIAGDNLFELDLKDLIDFAKHHRGISIAAFKVKNKECAKRFGVLKIKNNQIINFEEKPSNPKTRIISSAIYFFPKDHIDLIKKIGKNANVKSNIGHLIIDLIKKEKVYTFVSKGRFFDIGVLEDYEKANKSFGR
jgi:glucose-1-phosphate thymidylyltransferase